MGVRAVASSLVAWSPQDKAIIGALPHLLTEGRYFNEVMEIAATTDRILVEQHRRLLESARDKKIALRSALFAACYVWNGMEPPAIAIISAPLHSGTVRGPRTSPLVKTIRDQLARQELSHGQLYLLLALLRGAVVEEASIAGLLPSVLDRLWRGAAYHLRLELMYAARSASWGATDAERCNLIAALEGLPETENVIISTTIIEALKALGALDELEAEHTDVVRANIRRVFADQANPDMAALAHGIWYGQFDHPYDGAYCQAVSELSADDRKTLLTVAARGTELDAPFVSALIIDLAGFNDPALGGVIGKWTELPPVQCAMRQDALGNFAVAHIALGRLGCALPEIHGGESAGAQTLVACGQILYWMNRSDLPVTQRRVACINALDALSHHEHGVAAGVISEFYHAHTIWSEGLSRLPGTEPICLSICELFPAETVPIFRECLRNPTQQHGYFDWLNQNITFEFAVQVLGEWGNSTDIPLLRIWSVLSSTAQQALKAISKLEQAEMIAERA